MLIKNLHTINDFDFLKFFKQTSFKDEMLVIRSHRTFVERKTDQI